MSDSVRPHRKQPIRLHRPCDSQGKNTGVSCHFLLQCMKVKSESEVTQLCPTLRDPMDCSPLGSSVHGIFQARVLEWGARAFSLFAYRLLYNIKYSSPPFFTHRLKTPYFTHKEICFHCAKCQPNRLCVVDVPFIYPNLGNPSVERIKPDVKLAR